MANEVRLHISLRIREAVANAGLCAEVNDAVNLKRVSKVIERLGHGKVDPLKPKSVAVLIFKERKARLLQGRIVIVTEIIDADDLATLLEQGARCCSADKSRSSGDQNSHGRSLRAAVGGAKVFERKNDE